MELDILRWHIENGRIAAAHQIIALGEYADFLPRVSGDTPSVYTISEGQSARLQKYKDKIADRGQKNRKKPLSSYFLGAKRVPLLHYSFQSSRKAENSILKFLEKAAGMPSGNGIKTFFLALPDEEFKLLCKRHGKKNIASLFSEKAITDKRDATGTDFADDKLNSLVDDIPAKSKGGETDFKGVTQETKQVNEWIDMAANHDFPVIITGETGTGKNVVAGCIHKKSSRGDHPFCTINCSAISSSVFESELFGHRKGAFTGATEDRKGVLREACGGTVLLDEIGDMPLEQQAKVLDAIEKQEVKPVGFDKPVKINVRILAATNRNLIAMIKNNTFRQDLYHRLSTFHIPLKPLREQIENIEFLAQFFWAKISMGESDPLPADMIQELIRYRWPGNVRELRSVLASLFYYFRRRGKFTAEQLRSVFRLFSHVEPSDTPLSPHEISLHKAECLRHLKQAEDSLLTMKYLFEPIIEGKEKKFPELFPITIKNRMNELEFLNRRPLLFYDEGTFSTFTLLKGQLAYFFELLQQGQDENAMAFLRDKLYKHLQKSQSTLFKAVNAVLN